MLLMSDKQYNALKHAALVGVPALATLYFVIATTWHIPHLDQIMATFTAINTFLGGTAAASSLKYNNSDAKYDGVVEVRDVGADKRTFALSLNVDPEDIPNMNDVRLKVTPVPSSVVSSPGNPPQLGVNQ
jgi:hypothetical protein